MPGALPAGGDRATVRPSDIAIVGMAAVFPGAATVARFWANTLAGFDAITEVPPDRWDWRMYYDPDPKAPDKIVSKWGGFLPDITFDPLHYGMPPSSLPSIEPAQLLALEVVRAALADAGYAERSFLREQTGVVLGMGGGAAQLAMGYAFRSYLPMLDAVIPAAGQRAIDSCRGLLPEWTEDSFPGFLLNVTAGRIANRFNLGGANYTVDAACGSSLAAAALAVRELETGAADMMILGGVDTVQNPFTYLAFSKTQAFSPRGRCRPFDAGADGIVISEGVAALVLKRRADAERDGDRIYAVIKGVGASSDGRARGLTAPVALGQLRALERAYAKAGVSPATVGYVEAHGTGTALGDVVEIEALARVFRKAGAIKRGCAVGSVKSMIGHTKCAAGLAGLINASLALYHKVLPPTIGIDKPNPKLDLADGPLRLCTAAEPWLHAHAEGPRRAGVSAFGFGGTNFHAVLEEYTDALVPEPSSPLQDWPAELLVWRAAEPAELARGLDRLLLQLDRGARPPLCELAHTLLLARPIAGEKAATNRCATLAIVVGSHDDLREKLRIALAALGAGRRSLDDPRGVFFEAEPPFADAKVAFVFPGQGAQSPGMLRELAVVFPEVRASFEEFDRVIAREGGAAIGTLVYPPPAYTEQAREEARRALVETEVAQPAVGAACLGLLRLLSSLGCEPDIVAGHSYGELVALHAAGALDSVSLARLSAARGRLMREAGQGALGAMAALMTGPDEIERLLGGLSDVQAANWNSPTQTVIAGRAPAVQEALDRAAARGIQGRLLPVSSAFHTGLVAAAREPLARLAQGLIQAAPDRPVYSNLDAGLHPADPAAIAGRLGDHLASPVRFADMIAAMYQGGARVFVEVGPASTLTPLIDATLADRPHRAIACDSAAAPGLGVFLRALARLVVAGAPLRLERLTRGRCDRILDLDSLPADGNEPLAPSTWLVNGARARPAAAPEPARLGQATLTPLEAPPPLALPSDNGVGALETIMNPTAPRSADPVIESFQQTMKTFLEVQKTTMLAYLAAHGGPAQPVSPTPATDNGTENNSAPEPRGDSLAHKNGASQVLIPAPAAAAPPDRATVTARLLATVQDRTGYPLETLGLELDMEADLGIDSIKRVEILGKLRDEFPGLKGVSESAEAMDALARASTLGAIVEKMISLMEPSSSWEAPRESAMRRVAGAHVNGNGRHHAAVVRRAIEVALAPLPREQTEIMAGARIVIAAGDGVARGLEHRLAAAGVAAFQIGGPDEPVDWTSPASIDAALERLRQRGPLAGVVHALALEHAGESQAIDALWSARVNVLVKGLFLMAKALAPDLHSAARTGGACLIAATALGGRFASAGSTRRDFFPGDGGIAGLVKTLAREWPSVRSRVVDFTPGDSVRAGLRPPGERGFRT